MTISFIIIKFTLVRLVLRSIYKLDYRTFNIKDWDGRFAIGIEVLELTIERAHKPQDWEQDTQTWGVAQRKTHGVELRPGE